MHTHTHSPSLSLTTHTHTLPAPPSLSLRYDRLLSMFRRPGKQTSTVSVVGVTVMGEVVMSGVISAYIAGTVGLYTIYNCLVFVMCV